MKLSQLTTDQALDTLCQLTPHVTSITSDEEIVQSLGKIVNTQNLNRYGMFVAVMDRIGSIVPMLLRTHREDVYGILSILNEKDREEIAKQNFLETMEQAKEALADRELLAFFRSFTARVVSE